MRTVGGDKVGPSRFYLVFRRNLLRNIAIHVVAGAHIMEIICGTRLICEPIDARVWFLTIQYLISSMNRFGGTIKFMIS